MSVEMPLIGSGGCSVNRSVSQDERIDESHD